MPGIGAAFDGGVSGTGGHIHPVGGHQAFRSRRTMRGLCHHRRKPAPGGSWAGRLCGGAHRKLNRRLGGANAGFAGGHFIAGLRRGAVAHPPPFAVPPHGFFARGSGLCTRTGIGAMSKLAEPPPARPCTPHIGFQQRRSGTAGQRMRYRLRHCQPNGGGDLPPTQFGRQY